MLQLPAEPESENIRALAMWYRERLTGLTGTTLVLTNIPVQTVDGQSLELVVKNGAVLDPGTAYTIQGATITLTAAAVAGDVFLVSYLYRA